MNDSLKLAIDRLAKVRGQLESIRAELAAKVGAELEEGILIELPNRIRRKLDSAANDAE